MKKIEKQSTKQQEKHFSNRKKYSKLKLTYTQSDENLQNRIRNKLKFKGHRHMSNAYIFPVITRQGKQNGVQPMGK